MSNNKELPKEVKIEVLNIMLSHFPELDDQLSDCVDDVLEHFKHIMSVKDKEIEGWMTMWQNVVDTSKARKKKIEEMQSVYETLNNKLRESLKDVDGLHEYLQRTTQSHITSTTFSGECVFM